MVELAQRYWETPDAGKASDSGPPRAQVGWFSWTALREFEVRPNGYEPRPYSLPFSGTVVSLVSRECRITARSRVLDLPLGFRATRCTDPDGS